MNKVDYAAMAEAMTPSMAAPKTVPDREIKAWIRRNALPPASLKEQWARGCGEGRVPRKWFAPIWRMWKKWGWKWPLFWLLWTAAVVLLMAVWMR